MEISNLKQVEELCLKAIEKNPGVLEPYTILAELAIQQQDLENALVRWLDIVKKFPQHGPAYGRAAWCAMQKGAFDLAIQIGQTGQANAPTSIEPWVIPGDAAMRKMDFKEAVQAWALVREKFPEHELAYRQGALACMETGDFKQATTLGLKAIDMNPGSVEPYIAYAQIFMRKRDFEGADKAWALVREKFPDNELSYTQGAVALIELRDFAGAEALCLEVMAKMPEAREPYITYAEIAMRKGDFGTAKKRWQEVIGKFPQYGRGYNRIAWCALETGDFELAERMHREGREHAPESADVWFISADIAMRKRDFEEAERIWALARDKFPDKDLPYTQGARTRMELRDYVGAEKLCLEAMEKMPEAREPYATYAEAAMRKRDFEAAKKRWQEVIGKFPQYGRGYNRMAWCALETGDFELAERMHREGREQAPESADVWFISADIAMRKRDFEEADRIWALARDKFPDKDLPYSQGARTRMELRDYVGAEKLCLEAMEKMPEAREPYATYAEAAMRKRDFEAAKKRWQEVIGKFPQYGHGYNRMAWCALETGDFELAERMHREGMEQAPESADVWFISADIAMRKRDFEEADRIWALARDKFPDKDLPYSQGARTRMELRDFAGAEKLCLEAMEKMPEAREPYVTYAEIAMRKRDFGAAKKRWQEVIGKFPQYGRGYNRMAWCALETGDFELAERMHREGREQAPESADVWFISADIAMRKRDFEEADRAWALTRDKFPDKDLPYSQGAYARMQKNDFAGAEALCLEAMQKFPLASEPYITYAEISMRQRDFDKALDRWEIVRSKFPYADPGYFRAAWALVENGDFTGAEALCQEAMHKIPEAREPYVAYADFAMRQRDFGVAKSRWQAVIKKFPNHGRGYGGAAFACMETGDYEGGESFSLEGIRNAPQFIDSYISHAESAMWQRDFDKALERWEIVRSKFPYADPGYFRAAWALVEKGDLAGAEALCLEAMQKIPEALEPYVTYAEIVMRQRDFGTAKSRWQTVIEKFPTHGRGYSGAAFACMETGDYEGGDSFSLEGIRKAPQFIDSYISYAESAMWQRDYKNALERWALIRERFPSHGISYSRAAFACLELSDFAGAEALCKEGMLNAPEFLEPMAVFADILSRRDLHGLKGVRERWLDAKEKFPHHGHVYGALAHVCMELSDFEEGEAWCKEGMLKAPAFPDAWFMHAEIAMFQNDYIEAVKRWTATIARFPHNGVSYGRAAHALMELNSFEAAETMCNLGFKNAPGYPEPLITYAEIAMRKRDYRQAVERWRVLRERFPAFSEGETRGGIASMLIGDFEQAQALFEAGLRKIPWDVPSRRCLRYLDRMRNGEGEKLILYDQKFTACAEELIKKHNLGVDGRVGLIWFGDNIGDCYFFASAITYVQKVLKKHFVVITEEKCKLNKFIDQQNANGANIEKVCVDKETVRDLIQSSSFIREKYDQVLDFFSLYYKNRVLFNRGKRNDIYNNLTRIRHISHDMSKYINQLGIIPGKTVFINPHANAFGKTPIYFWKICIFLFRILGYKIVINQRGNKREFGDDVIYFSPPLDEIVDFADFCGLVLGVRSGLLEMIAAEGSAKMVVLHPEDPIGDITEIYPFINNTDNHIVEVRMSKRWLDDPLLSDIQNVFQDIGSGHVKAINVMADMLGKTSRDGDMSFKVANTRFGRYWAKTRIPTFHIPTEPSTFNFCSVQYRFYAKDGILYLDLKVDPGLPYEIHFRLLNKLDESYADEYKYYNSSNIVFRPETSGEYYVQVLISHPVTKANCLFETHCLNVDLKNPAIHFAHERENRAGL